MNLNDIISANLKKLRTDRNLSLGQLSELSGVSKVMLSQIDKGESNPTINTIWKIANGLQVTYTKLIDSPMRMPLSSTKSTQRSNPRIRIPLSPTVTIPPIPTVILNYLRLR